MGARFPCFGQCGRAGRRNGRSWNRLGKLLCQIWHRSLSRIEASRSASFPRSCRSTPENFWKIFQQTLMRREPLDTIARHKSGWPPSEASAHAGTPQGTGRVRAVRWRPSSHLPTLMHHRSVRTTSLEPVTVVHAIFGVDPRCSQAGG